MLFILLGPALVSIPNANLRQCRWAGWSCLRERAGWSTPSLFAQDFADELADLDLRCWLKTLQMSRLICTVVVYRILHGWAGWPASVIPFRLCEWVDWSVVRTSLCDTHVDLHLHCSHQSLICIFVIHTRLRGWAGHLCWLHQTVWMSRLICTFVCSHLSVWMRWLICTFVDCDWADEQANLHLCFSH